MTEVNLNDVIIAIISVSATVAGISAAFMTYMWDKLRCSIGLLESPNPMEAEVARRDICVIRFIVIPFIFSIVLLSITAVFGLITFIGSFLPTYCSFLMLLLFFCTGLYSFLIPFLIALRDDLRLIRLHTELLEREG